MMVCPACGASLQLVRPEVFLVGDRVQHHLDPRWRGQVTGIDQHSSTPYRVKWDSRENEDCEARELRLVRGDT